MDSETPTERDAPYGFSLLVAAIAVVTPVFYWYSRAHVRSGDAASAGAFIAAAELCFVVAWAMLRWVPTSAMLATGLAATTSIVFMLGTSLWVGLSWVLTGNRSAQPFKAVCFVTLALCLLIAWRGLARSKGSRGSFAGGVLVGLLLLTVASSVAWSALSARLEESQRSISDDRTREVRASRLVYELTACALRQRYLTPGAAFPDALASIPTGIDCTGLTARPDSIDGYSISYTPRRNAAGGAITDFQIAAVPSDPNHYVATVVADGRGLIFTISAPSPASGRSDTGAFFFRRSNGLGSALVIRAEVTEYMERHAGAAAPASLAEMAAADSSSRLARLARRVGRDSVYRVEYIAASAPQSRSFAIVSTCLLYGTECIRSYYLAPDGSIHATGEPRPAVESDPLIVDREDSDGARVRSGVGWHGR